MDVNSVTELPVSNSEAAPQSAVARRSRPKEIWLIFHRWAGVIIGLPIALIGLSGSLILLAPLMLSLQHGDLLERTGSSGKLPTSPAEWIATVRAANTNKLEIIAVSAPNSSPVAADTALVIGHTHEGAEGHHHRVFSVNPDTGRLLGYYDFETAYAYIPVAIHTSLMIPLIGLNLVAVIGFILLFSSATGIYLWWPRPKAWKAAFRFKNGARGLARWFSLHNVVGVYSAIAVFILSATGVWILKPDWVDPVVDVATPLRGAPPLSSISRKDACANTTTVEEAVNLATKHLPNSTLAYVVTPEEDRKFFEINLSNPSNWNVRDGDTTVYVDPACARIVSTTNSDSLSAGEAVKRATVPLHNGLMFGTVGQVFVFLAGLALPILYISGLILWWRRRKQRRAS